MPRTKIPPYFSQMEQLDEDQMRILLLELHKQLKSNHTKSKSARTCPHCHLATNVKQHGYYLKEGIQEKRYYCKTCRVTFNTYSKNITYRCKFPDKWPSFLRCILVDQRSIRETAKQLGISPKTSYLWRKKIVKILPELKHVLPGRGKTSE